MSAFVFWLRSRTHCIQLRTCATVCLSAPVLAAVSTPPSSESVNGSSRLACLPTSFAVPVFQSALGCNFIGVEFERSAVRELILFDVARLVGLARRVEHLEGLVGFRVVILEDRRHRVEIRAAVIPEVDAAAGDDGAR